MIYLWPQATMPPDGFGVLTAPATKIIAEGIRAGRPWAMDNGAFTQGFQPDAFFPFLERHEMYRDTCLFVAVPDVVGDAIQTLANYRHWVTHFDGWPVAFVAQDGQENLPMPNYYDWLFVGGGTEWKMSSGADRCIQRAKEMGKQVHIGRVNSIKRFRHFQLIGADTSDGTFPVFAPDVASRRLGRAMAQRPLFRDLPTSNHRG